MGILTYHPERIWQPKYMDGPRGAILRTRQELNYSQAFSRLKDEVIGYLTRVGLVDAPEPVARKAHLKFGKKEAVQKNPETNFEVKDKYGITWLTASYEGSAFMNNQRIRIIIPNRDAVNSLIDKMKNKPEALIIGSTGVLTNIDLCVSDALKLHRGKLEETIVR